MKNLLSKKAIVLILLALVVVFIFIVTFSASKQSSKPTVLEPRIANYVNGEFTVKSTLTKKDFNFPTSSKTITLEVGKSFTKDEAKIYASKFGFTEEPREAVDITEGTTYLWKNDTESLLIYSKSRKVKYGLSVRPQVIHKQLSNEAITGVAKDFLTSKIFGTETAFNFSEIVFLSDTNQSTEGFYQTTKEKASIYQVNFSPIASQKTLTLDPQTSPVFVWVLPDGSIFKAQAVVFSSFREGETEYPLKNFEQFSNTLGSATVVSLDDGNIYLPDLAEGDLEEVVVKKAELFYFLESINTPILQPVFLLTGDAKIRNRAGLVSAWMYLPAFSTIQP